MQQIRQDPETLLYYFVDTEPEPEVEVDFIVPSQFFADSYFEHDGIGGFLVGNPVEFEYVPLRRPAEKPKAAKPKRKYTKRKSLKARKAA